MTPFDARRPRRLDSIPRRVLPLALLLLSTGACASTPVERSRPEPSGLDSSAFEPAAGSELPENVATAILVGSALLEAGDARGALPYYGFAFGQDPTDRELGTRYVEVALRAGQAQEALKALDLLLENDPEDLELAVQRSRLWMLVGENDRARTEGEALLDAHPDDFAVLDLNVDLRLGDRDWEGALGLVDRMLESHPDEPALWSRRADLLDALARPEEAEESYRQALELDPTDAEAIDRLSERMRADGRDDELIELLESLRARTELTPLIQARLADLYLARGDIEATVDLLTPLFEAGELEARAQIVLADLLASLDRREEALELLEDLVAAGVRGGPVLRMTGELQLELGRLEDAESSLRQAVELDADDADAHVSLLLVMTQRDPGLMEGQGDPAQLARFRELAAHAETIVSPESLRQNYLLGAILRRSGEEERARPLLRRASTLDPDNRQVLYDLAIAQEATKEYRAAAATLDRLIEIDPDDAHLLNFYGYLLADQGWELDRAEDMVRRALREEPENGAYLDSLGWVLYRKGDLEGALDLLIEATNRLGDDPVVLEHLGDCLRDLGQIDEARRTYRRALQVGGDVERLQGRLDALGDSGEQP